jgi:Mce-associated membrane protein
LNRRLVTNTALVNAGLAVILLGLVGWLAVFAIRGSVAAPGSTPAEEQARAYTDIRRAARAETVAFLTVDHTRMDELTDRVLAGATGDFKKQYQESLESLKESATSQESFAEGSVAEVGLGEVDADSATAFVAAGSKVRNKSTDGKVEDRSWRIKLTMANEDGRWLVSKLEFVG